MNHAAFMEAVRERLAMARRSSPMEFQRWERQVQEMAPQMKLWATKLEKHVKLCGPCSRNMNATTLRLPNRMCVIGDCFTTRFHRAYFLHHQAIVQLQKLYYQVERLEPVRRSGNVYDSLNRRYPKRIPWQSNPRHRRFD